MASARKAQLRRDQESDHGTAIAVLCVMSADRHLVLLVDDEEAYLLSVADGLARYASEFGVLTAHDGLDALQLISEKNPSLVVSDIRMPNMDGIELLLTSRKEYPTIPFILVSAFFSESLQRSAKAFGAARILHKPLDLETLLGTIREVLAAARRGQDSLRPAGFLPAFSLPGFLQLVAMEQKTCALKVRSGSEYSGTLWIEKGRLIDAEFGTLVGTAAALRLLTWENPDITLESFQRARDARITEGINFLLMESARLRDEAGYEEGGPEPLITLPEPLAGPDQGPGAGPISLGEIGTPQPPQKEKEPTMSNMEEVLKKLQDISGFMAVGVFTPDSEMIAHIANAGVAIGEIGALANDVLLKAQKATDIMNVGRGNVVTINAPRAIIMMRCLNENTDFAASEPGRAHIHTALLLEPEGNVGLAKMQLEKVCQALATHAR